MEDFFKGLSQSKAEVIGEIACGHEGDTQKLRQLIDCVADSGCSVIKFQIFKTHERAKEKSKEWDIFSSLELHEGDWVKYANYAKKLGLLIFADVYGYESLKIADKIGVAGYKIHSEDLLNTNFIIEVLKRQKVTIIGVGGARRSEIKNLLSIVSNEIYKPRMILMTGIQVFPTPIEAHSITEVSDLLSKYSKYGVKIGFSDHVEGNKAESYILPLMAISAGAVLIEKHITIDRYKKWIDYHSALGCSDFKKFIKQINNLKLLLDDIKPMSSHEESYRKMFKKSPVFSKDLNKGQILKKTDIEYLKDVENSMPLEASKLVGKSLSSSVKKGMIASLNNFDTNIGAIIVARCGSSRLPHKALLKINNRESIAIVIDRIKKCKNVSKIILATTKDSEDDQLVKIAEREGIYHFRGSKENVALRYLEASKHFKLDHFVRITGDAIMCDEVMIDKAITSHLSKSCDVTMMKNMPFGTHKEVVSVSTIKSIIDNASNPNNTEYLEYFLENSRNFNINYISSDYKFDHALRITLDYKEDLSFFRAVYKHFGNDKSFTLKEALDWLETNPEIVKINSHMRQKTPENQGLDITLKI